MRSSLNHLGIFVMVGAALLIPATAKADVVPFFNTGVNGLGVQLADGATDSHWTVNNVAAKATSTNPSWLSNPSSLASKWISTVGNAASVAGGTYLFKTTFDLTGFDASTASLVGRWTSDNKTVAVRLNGVATGITNANEPFGGWGNFNLNSGFVAGLNTLEFEVFNGINSTPINSPLGLRVEGTLNARIPEPGTLGLLLVAGAGALALRRRASR